MPPTNEQILDFFTRITSGKSAELFIKKSLPCNLKLDAILCDQHALVIKEKFVVPGHVAVKNVMFILLLNHFINLTMLLILCFFPFSEKLDVEMETVRHGVEGLMYLLTESAKLMVSQFCLWAYNLKVAWISNSQVLGLPFEKFVCFGTKILIEFELLRLKFLECSRGDLFKRSELCFNWMS